MALWRIAKDGSYPNQTDQFGGSIREWSVFADLWSKKVRIIGCLKPQDLLFSIILKSKKLIEQNITRLNTSLILHFYELGSNLMISACKLLIHQVL